MRTQEFSTKEKTLEAIDAYARAGHILHGSPLLHLATLLPGVSASLSVHTATGERRTNPQAVHGTLYPEHAIFYGTIHAVVRNAGLHRASALKPRLLNNAVLDYDYFLSDSGKDLIADRVKAKVKSSANACTSSSFSQVPGFQEWVAATGRSVDVLGSVAVTADLLPFNIFDLASPDSDPDIHRYYVEAGVPAEN